MNGAQSLVRTLIGNDVNTCFANPGTSEMHFVAALDKTPEMRCILGLFEGVVTGAADGYGRMLDKPAATLLHLGPGLANGLSNLHNAKRANSPVVNVIGDHATYHRSYDAPLTSDIEGAARPFSDWVRTTGDADSVASDTAAAIGASLSNPGRIATLILPADAAWSELRKAQTEIPRATTVIPEEISPAKTVAAAKLLRAEGTTAIILDARLTRDRELALAGQISIATGADLVVPTQSARISRGAGRVPVKRIPYGTDVGIAALKEYENIILIGPKAPVAFFAYPDKPSELLAPGTHVLELANESQDVVQALEALHAEVGAGGAELILQQPVLHEKPTGAITPEKIGHVLGTLLPENAIVVEEALTSGRTFLRDTQGSAPHDWLFGTGGSIGYALSSSVGAAIAAPNRKVVTLQADGSGLYMPQALWTQAREGLDIVTLVFANRKYQILRNEMQSVGADFSGPRAEALLDIGNPDIDWVAIGAGFGVPSVRVETMEELHTAFARALSAGGPRLIEILL